MKKKTIKFSLMLLISFAFIDIVRAETYNNYVNDYSVSCGDNLLTNIPPAVPQIISIIYTVIQIAVPVLLVVMGSIDLMKGITAGKEEEAKKGQQLFIKRLISGVLVFFVMILVKIVISFGTENIKIIDCAECLIKNNCTVNKK